MTVKESSKQVFVHGVELALLVGFEDLGDFSEGVDPIEGLTARKLHLEVRGHVFGGGWNVLSRDFFDNLAALEHQKETLLFAHDRCHHESGEIDGAQKFAHIEILLKHAKAPLEEPLLLLDALTLHCKTAPAAFAGAKQKVLGQLTVIKDDFLPSDERVDEVDDVLPVQLALLYVSFNTLECFQSCGMGHDVSICLKVGLIGDHTLLEVFHHTLSLRWANSTQLLWLSCCRYGASAGPHLVFRDTRVGFVAKVCPHEEVLDECCLVEVPGHDVGHDEPAHEDSSTDASDLDQKIDE